MSALFVAEPAARQPRSTGRFWLRFHAGGRRARRGHLFGAISGWRSGALGLPWSSVGDGCGSGRPLSPGPAGWFVPSGEGGCGWAFVMGLGAAWVCAGPGVCQGSCG